MAAYRRVYDSRHLQADCQEPGSAPEPCARQSSMRYLFTDPSSSFCTSCSSCCSSHCQSHYPRVRRTHQADDEVVIVSVVVSAHVGNLQPDELHREATTRRRINRSVNYPSIGLYSFRFISLIVKNTQQACINVEQRFAHA